MVNENKTVARIAVYGTLKQGWGNHRLLQKDPIYTGYVNIDSISGTGFPSMKLGDKEKLYVEVYDVTESEFRMVDSLEGYEEGRIPTFYNRVKTKVTKLDDGTVEDVWIYEIVRDITDTLRDVCEEECTAQGSVYTWLGGYR